MQGLPNSLHQVAGKFPKSFLLFLLSGCFPANVWNRLMRRHLQSGQIAVRTGTRCDLIVLDVDPREGEPSLPQHWDLPSTLTVITSRGYHLYFRPHCNVKYTPSSHDVIQRGLDVRADFGYVVAPPSTHPDGNFYRVKDFTVPMAELPLSVALELKNCGAPRFRHVKKLWKNSWKIRWRVMKENMKAPSQRLNS